MNEKDEKMLGLKEVSKRLGISTVAVRKAILTKRLNAKVETEVKVINHFTVSESDVEKYLKNTVMTKEGRRWIKK